MFFITVYSILMPVSWFFSVQVDECDISRNLGNNLSESVHHFWAIAHGKGRKTVKIINLLEAPERITTDS